MNGDAIRACPACYGHKGYKLGEKSGFLVFRCSACRTLYTDHVPKAEQTQDYDEYYGESNLTVPDFIRQRALEIISGFDKYRTTGRLLDIGFGAGTLLNAARQLGWDAHGLEVSKPAIEHARKQGYEVFHGDLVAAKFPTGHFDVVTASEIIEHLNDPATELKEIVRILRPGGLFWGTTPSARSASFRILGLDWSVLSPPEHLQIYSKAGASLILKEAGFDSVSFKTAGLNPMEIVDHFRRKDPGGEPFNRVGSAYNLNAELTKSGPRKFVKSALNGVLDFFQMGDSLKIFAETK